jgi:predicted ATPase
MGGLRGITRAAALALFSVQGALCKEVCKSIQSEVIYKKRVFTVFDPA